MIISTINKYLQTNKNHKMKPFCDSYYRLCAVSNKFVNKNVKHSLIKNEEKQKTSILPSMSVGQLMSFRQGLINDLLLVQLCIKSSIICTKFCSNKQEWLVMLCFI